MIKIKVFKQVATWADGEYPWRWAVVDAPGKWFWFREQEMASGRTSDQPTALEEAWKALDVWGDFHHHQEALR